MSGPIWSRSMVELRRAALLSLLSEDPSAWTVDRAWRALPAELVRCHQQSIRTDLENLVESGSVVRTSADSGRVYYRAVRR